MWGSFFVFGGSVQAISSGDVVKLNEQATLYYVGADNMIYNFPSVDVFFNFFNTFSIVKIISQEEFNQLDIGGEVSSKILGKNIGRLIKASNSASIYFLGSDNRRYVFPSVQIFNTWYSDFDDIETLSPAEVVSFPLASNVNARPGLKLVQAVTNDTPWQIADPKVYAVSSQGVLRHIQKADVAAALFGERWETRIIPMAETVFSQYSIGAPIESALDYNIDVERGAAFSINVDKGVVSTKVPTYGNGINFGILITDGSTAADQLAPEISSIMIIDAGPGSVSVTWMTDEPASTVVEYGINIDEYNLNYVDAERTTVHNAIINDLQKDTNYYFKIKSADANSNLNSLEDFVFRTFNYAAGVSPPYDQEAPTIYNINHSSVNQTRAWVKWTTNEPATSIVEYGLVEGSYTKATSSSYLSQKHSILLEGLNPGTTYYYKVSSSDEENNAASRDGFSFITTNLAFDVASPFLSGVTVYNIGRSSVDISWTTNELADSVVEVGTKPGEYIQLVADSNYITQHKFSLPNLLPDTTYYFKVSSSDTYGNVAQSLEKTFITAKNI